RPFFSFWAYNFNALVAGGIALLIYTVIRAGLLTILAGPERGGTGSAPLRLDPNGITALAGLCGSFAGNAATKLKEVAEILFATRQQVLVMRTPKAQEQPDDADRKVEDLGSQSQSE